MLTANQIKYIKSLQKKKFRQQNNCFVIEGVKQFESLLNSKYNISKLYVLNTALDELNKFNIPEDKINIITQKEISRISAFKTPSKLVALVKIPKNNLDIDYHKPILCLDNIQDPGNMGTIIRTASWFGFKQIVCSNDTVELYNPKVLQSTMGAFVNINIKYADLIEFIQNKPNETNVYGTFLEGDNVYQTNIQENSIIIIGNEGKGISLELKKYINKKIFIPPARDTKAESLNASIATAVVLSEYARINLN